MQQQNTDSEENYRINSFHQQEQKFLNKGEKEMEEKI